MNDQFCLLLRAEFISILNYLELKGISVVRVFDKPEKLLSVLRINASMDFEEDYLIVKCSNLDNNFNQTDNVINLNIENLIELIPLTQASLQAYRRKFSHLLKWEDPAHYKFEEYYTTYLIEKTRYDSIKSFELFSRDLLQIDGYEYISKELLVKVIDAKIEKQLKGKKDIEIKEKDYSHLYQSVMVYEQGSHLPRETAFGFFLHTVGMTILHLGNGQKLQHKINLSKTNSVKKLVELNEKRQFKGINDVFCLDVFETIRSLKLNVDLNSSEQDTAMMVATYFLLFKFFIEEKNISTRKLIAILSQLNSQLSREETTALLLIAVNRSIKEMAEDLIISDGQSLIMADKVSFSHEEVEMISNYYKGPTIREVPPKKIEKRKITELGGRVIEKPTTTSKDLDTNDFDVLKKIKDSLPKHLKNTGQKRSYYNEYILPQYKEELLDNGYKIEGNEEMLFREIFSLKSKRP